MKNKENIKSWGLIWYVAVGFVSKSSLIRMHYEVLFPALPVILDKKYKYETLKDISDVTMENLTILPSGAKHKLTISRRNIQE